MKLPILWLTKCFLSKPKKRAAVFVALCNNNNIPSVLFTLRANTMRRHKGQVSFPGGHVEPGETVFQAALRETEEELGINRNRLETLGMCEPLTTIYGVEVTPVVGFIAEDLADIQLKPNPAEVSKVFVRSIDELTDPSLKRIRKVSKFGFRTEFPCFGSVGDPLAVWGMTAMFLDSVLKEAVIPIFEETKLS